MLTVTLAHTGPPPTPENIWAAWNSDPLLIAALLGAGWVYARGHARLRTGAVARRRLLCFSIALAALAVALVSPLDAAATALASAHMAQHVLLVLVAAPLLALSAPLAAFLAQTPRPVLRRLGPLRRRLRMLMGGSNASAWVAVWLLHAGTLWLWHGAALYGAALEHPVLHVVEHASFLLTGLLFWHVAVGPGGILRAPPGLGILLVFAMGMASTFLSVLLTFARTPWYAAYAETTRAWGLTPLADQQLAGVIMWVPAGFVYAAAALALLTAWLRQTEDEPASPAPLLPQGS